MITLTTVILIVTALSIVQSMFGMGILVFGTPTLLLLGMPFPEVLACTLPASVCLSALQIFDGRDQKIEAGGLRSLGLAIPFVAIGLVLNLSKFHIPRLDLFAGGILLISAVIRLFPDVRERLYGWIRSSRFSYIGAMGLLHGLSNMGGAALAVYASSVTTEKRAMRMVVASFYFVFGVTQLIVLGVMHPSVLTLDRLAVVPCAAAMYLLVGNWAFAVSKEHAYQRYITFFTAAYGLSICVRAFL